MKKAKIFLGLAVVLITVLFAVIACKDEDSEEAKKTEEQSGPTYVANVLPAPAKKITVDYLDEFEGQYVTIIGSIDGGMLYTFKAVDSNGVVTFGKITNGTVELPVYKLDAGNSSFSSSTAYNGTGSVTAMIRVMGNLEKVAFSQITTYYPTDNDKKRDRTSSFTSENTLALSWLDPGEPFTSIAQFKSWYDKQLATGANGTPYNVKINISDLGGVNPSAKDYYARQNSNLNYWVI